MNDIAWQCCAREIPGPEAVTARVSAEVDGETGSCEGMRQGAGGEERDLVGFFARAWVLGRSDLGKVEYVRCAR